MPAGIEGLDGKLGPLIPVGKWAVDAVPLALLDHRGKLLEAESTFPYRLVQYFGLRGAKVFGAAAEFHSKDCVDFFTFPKGPRGENADVRSSGVQALCHYEINGLGSRFLDEKSTYSIQKFLLHVV